MLAARAGSKYVGYLGLMHGSYTEPSGSKIKVAWTSTFYVIPEYRSKAVGVALVLRARQLGIPILSMNVSQHASQILMACGFRTLGTVEYFKAKTTPAPFIKKALRFVNRLGLNDTKVAQHLHRLAAEMLHPRLECALGELGPEDCNCRLRRINNIDEIPSKILEMTRTEGRFVRDYSELHWMLKHHWVTTKRAEKIAESAFPDYRAQFGYWIFSIENAGGEVFGFVITRADTRGDCRRVTTLDFNLADPETAVGIVLLRAAILTSLATGANEVTLPVECSSILSRSRELKGIFHRLTRSCLCFDPNEQLTSGEHTVRFFDGDVAFA